MLIDMVMPKMGESITEGTVLRWHKAVGDVIAPDETVLEISTDKVDSEVPSPSAGRLAERLLGEGETAEVGVIIARIETDIHAALGSSAPAAPSAAATEASADEPAMTDEPVAAAGTSSGEMSGEKPRFLSPLVRSIASKEGLSDDELNRVAGTGVGGRVTKGDLLSYLKTRSAQPTLAPKPVSMPTEPAVSQWAEVAPPPAPVPTAAPAAPTTASSATVEVVAMDTMRQRIAEHMVRSKQTSPHVYSVTECDMTRIVKYREQEKSAFESRTGVKLTYLPFVLRAVAQALREFPLVNASVEGTNILLRKEIHLGIAAEMGDRGLVVPVIRHADEKNLVGLARSVQDLGSRTRARKLSPDELQGGTFTVTNVGSFGNLMGVPIINQPQVAILATGAIVKKPVVVTVDGDDTLAVRSIMTLVLSYDHRVIDGAVGGRFIERVKALLEAFDPRSV